MLERSQNLRETRPHSFNSSGLFFSRKMHTCAKGVNMQSQESEALQARYRLACELAKAGAELAFEYYQQREAERRP